MAQLYLAQFAAEEETPLLVADSALYSADTLQALSPIRWVTRVPATLTEAKTLLSEMDLAQMTAAERAGYFYHEATSTYGGVAQRWLVVLYLPRREEELVQLNRRIERERNDVAKAIKKLARQRFSCAEDARQALAQFAKQWSFHAVSGEVAISERYRQPGRPTPDSPKLTAWHIRGTFQRDEVAIVQQQKPLGKYIIATNELDQDKCPTEDLLTVYKDQNRSVERGFRFLKDPLFFASRFFLKKPARLMGLLMVMGLSLLVYALAEHHLRQQLAESDQSIPDQKGRATQRPTMRWVFQLFEGIHVLRIQTNEFRKRTVTNVREVHLQIATLLGEPMLKFYVSSH